MTFGLLYICIYYCGAWTLRRGGFKKDLRTWINTNLLGCLKDLPSGPTVGGYAAWYRIYEGMSSGQIEAT